MRDGACKSRLTVHVYKILCRLARCADRPLRQTLMETRLERVRSSLATGTKGERGQAGAVAAASASSAAPRGNESKSESGTFNEKERRAEKNAALSHLLFSSFGLDHFPRYLSRWSLDEVTSLEAQLAEQLELVRQQKAEMLAAAAEHALYRSLSPCLSASLPLLLSLSLSLSSTRRTGGSLCARTGSTWTACWPQVSSLSLSVCVCVYVEDAAGEEGACACVCVRMGVRVRVRVCVCVCVCVCVTTLWLQSLHRSSGAVGLRRTGPRSCGCVSG